MVPFALGTQTAGSVIRPASYCGVYGFKPTRGLISRRGVLLQSHTLDTVGVFARTLEDLALATDVMSAFDPLDEVSYRRSQPRLLDFLQQNPPLPPLFAYAPTPAFDAHAEPSLREAFAELVDTLMPHNVEQIETPSLTTAADAQAIIQLVENSHHYGPFLGARRDLLTPALATRLDVGGLTPAGEYLTALDLRETLYGALESMLRDYSAILTPAAAGPAPAGLAATGSPIFNGLWTFLGCPCLSLPLMETEDGLPIGVQLVGARGDDARLLRTARWLVEHVSAQA
jgi:Asp-tRNA(Asn)/Glu-tRNA(Gln) amidotransferase A subunit family amidase